MNLQKYTEKHTQAALARQINYAPTFVSKWVNGTAKVPAKACILIEQATQGQVTRKDLKKDWKLIWPELVHTPTIAKASLKASPKKDYVKNPTMGENT
jgi:DNA-binding transcriptional regulator YdaS (Cro superfamily)